jgi:hypothetical protein
MFVGEESRIFKPADVDQPTPTDTNYGWKGGVYTTNIDRSASAAGRGDTLACTTPTSSYARGKLEDICHRRGRIECETSVDV